MLVHKIFLIILVFVVFLYIIYRVYKSYTDDLGFVPSEDNDYSKSIIDQIENLKAAGRYQDAFNVAKAYMANTPKSPQARYIYAKLLYDVEKYYDAIGHLNLILRTHPKYTDAILLLGDCFSKTKQNAKSVAVLKNIVDADPNNMPALLKLANLYVQKKEKRLAIPIYKKMIELTKDEEEKRALYLKIAAYYFEMREWGNLINEASVITELYPNDKNILMYLKKAYDICHDIKNSILVIERLIELDPYNPRNFEDIVPLLRLDSQFDKSISYCETALKIRGINRPIINANMAKTFIAKKVYEKALDLLKQSISLDNGDAELKKTLSDLYCEINDYEQAITTLDSLIDEVQPKDVESIMLKLSNVYFKYGNFLVSNKDYNNAFHKYEKAIANDPNNPEFHFVLAEINSSIKNYTEAIRSYKSAIEINPKASKYYLRLACVYYDLDNNHEAKKYFSDAILIQPDSVLAHASLGLINAKQKNADAAIISFQTAINLEPDNTDIRYNLALAYELSGNVHKAIEEYKQVLEVDPSHIGAKNNLDLLTNMY